MQAKVGVESGAGGSFACKQAPTSLGMLDVGGAALWLACRLRSSIGQGLASCSVLCASPYGVVGFGVIVGVRIWSVSRAIGRVMGEYRSRGPALPLRGKNRPFA